MTKIFCDVCGEEVHANGHYGMGVRVLFTFGRCERSLDMCRKCSVRMLEKFGLYLLDGGIIMGEPDSIE